MLTRRNIALALGAALVVAVAPSGGGGVAAATTQARHGGVSAAGDLPDVRAPYVGTVSGARPADAAMRDSAAARAFKQLRSTSAGAVGPAYPGGPPDLHMFTGTSFNCCSVGAQATHSVSTAIKPTDPNTYVYAPTILPSGGSCIEVTTAYSYYRQVVWAWDWCQSQDVAQTVTIDAAFMQTYTKYGKYSVRIMRTNAASNTWTAYLYNYVNGAWQKFYSQSGTPTYDAGWDIYEIYTDYAPDGTTYACGDLAKKHFEAKAIKQRVGRKWLLADASNSSDMGTALSSFDCPNLTYTMVTPNSHWKATG